MTKLKPLLVQAQLNWKDPAANRAHLESLVEQARAEFNLAVFPETFTTGFLGDTSGTDEGMHGETLEWMQSMAQTHKSAMAGSVVIVEEGQRYNRMLFVTPNGSVRHYDKKHLFAFGGENKRYTAGGDRVNVDYLGWRINLQVCYDLRFPVWMRLQDDYDLVLLVANWPSRREAHWSALLRARAIENQCYVIGVNRVGKDGNGLEYPGSSVAHDPLGETLLHLGNEECAAATEFTLDMVQSTRDSFPFQADADEFFLRDK